jgi:hypothetical protein
MRARQMLLESPYDAVSPDQPRRPETAEAIS